MMHLQMFQMAPMQPEQLTGYNADAAWGRALLGPAADVWALGATLYHMLVGHVPFGGASHDDLVGRVLALNYDTRPEVLSVGARQLIDSMLQVLPSDRAQVTELCCDPWIVAELGPMPPEPGSVRIECGDGHAELPHDRAPLAVLFATRGRRWACYLGIVLTVCALARRHAPSRADRAG